MDGLLRTYRLVDRAIYDLEALLAGLGLGLSVLVTLVDVFLRNGGELVESVTGIRISGGIGGGDHVGEGGDGIRPVGVGALPGMDAGVGVLHEAVEMDALAALDAGGGEEQVHEHGLAAADGADEVEAVWGCDLGGAAEEAGEAWVGPGAWACVWCVRLDTRLA